MKKEELFTLVKSLSRSEKRYFKVFASQMGSGSNYVKLFDVIDKQTEFDEAAIRKKFKGERMLKQLHVTKNYLRQLILKSLRNFHQSLSKDAEVKDILRNVEILFHKELFEHCVTELRRAERLSNDFELLVGQLEIASWKRKLEQAQRPQNYEGLKGILDEKDLVLSKLENTHEYWRLAVGISGEMFGKIPSPEKKVELLEHENNAQTLEAKVLHFNTLYVSMLRNGESDKAFEALESLLGYLEQFPNRTKEDAGLYWSTVNNLVSFHVFNQAFDKGLELLRRGRSFTESFQLKSEKRSLLKQVFRSYNIELEIYRNMGSFEENAPFIAQMESFVEENRFKIPLDYCFSFWFQFGYIAFMRKDFDHALHWVNFILNTRHKKVRVDLQIQARILNLMVHLEQQNLFVLNYFVSSARRFFRKQDEVKPHERILLQFFSRMGRLPIYDWADAFHDLEMQLYPPGKEALVPEEVAGYIDYRKWIRERG